MKTQDNTTTTPEANQNPLVWWKEAQEKSTVLARWMALYEAVNLIGDKADERNIPLEKIKISPLDIEDYMAATEDIFLKKILEEDYKIKICHLDDAPPEYKEIFNDIDVELTP